MRNLQKLCGVASWLFVIVMLSSVSVDAAVPHALRPIDDTNCRIIDQAARDNRLSVSLLTRLIWTESRFHAGAISPAGAQGIAQFMPTTANERGLADPFDPQQAIPHAATLIADLKRQFGTVGLAVAAYNAGPNRVGRWLGRNASLPRETRAFVVAVTGRSVEDWAATGSSVSDMTPGRAVSCAQLRSFLRDVRSYDAPGSHPHEWTGLRERAVMLPILWTSGRILPGLQGSGRPLPGLRNSGLPLAPYRQIRPRRLALVSRNR